jgi:hypothetical protein
MLDGMTSFYSEPKFLEYKPPVVNLVGIPSTPLKSELQPCQISSSVDGTIASDIFTTGMRSRPNKFNILIRFMKVLLIIKYEY